MGKAITFWSKHTLSYQTIKDRLKKQFTQKWKVLHPLLILMLFQNHMSFLSLFYFFLNETQKEKLH